MSYRTEVNCDRLKQLGYFCPDKRPETAAGVSRLPVERVVSTSETHIHLRRGLQSTTPA